MSTIPGIKTVHADHTLQFAAVLLAKCLSLQWMDVTVEWLQEQSQAN
jgi:hypothetical protein